MAVLRLKNKSYQVDFWLYGERIRKSFPDQERAQLFRDKLTKTERLKALALTIAVQKYLRYETDTRKSAQSRRDERMWFSELLEYFRTDEKILRDFGHPILVSSVSRFHLEKFQAHLQEKGSLKGERLKNASINRRFHTIKNLFSTLVRWGFLETSPAAGIRKLPEKFNPRPRWKSQEVARVLENPKLGAQESAIIRFLLATGVRLGSALDLKEDDLDLTVGSLLVRQRKGTGAETHYVIPISPSTCEMIRPLLAGDPQGFVFRDRAGRRLQTDLVSKRCIRSFRRLGLSHLTLHGLRHTFASELHAAGASTETVRLLLGHKTVTTTEKYLHTDFDHLKKWIK